MLCLCIVDRANDILDRRFTDFRAVANEALGRLAEAHPDIAPDGRPDEFGPAMVPESAVVRVVRQNLLAMGKRATGINTMRWTIRHCCI